MQNLIDTLNKVFAGKHTGTYIDVGAYDGVTDSVTNHFYEQGWRGVCIEPQTKYYKMGMEARPEDTWIKGVVVGKEYEGSRVTFYEDEDGRQSSTWLSSVEMKKKQLKAIKFNDDVPRDIIDVGLDLMVISVSGSEWELLPSIDLGLWKPNIVAVFKFVADEDDIIGHMNSMGYYHLAPDKTDTWLVFSNRVEDRASV
jgi:hypothetical protein